MSNDAVERRNKKKSEVAQLLKDIQDTIDKGIDMDADRDQLGEIPAMHLVFMTVDMYKKVALADAIDILAKVTAEAMGKLGDDIIKKSETPKTPTPNVESVKDNVVLFKKKELH